MFIYPGDLAVVHTEELNKFLTALSKGKISWLGGIRIGHRKDNDQWTWIDGTPMNYSNWHSKNNEHCLQLNVEGKRGVWNDGHCEDEDDINVKTYLCQSDSLS